LSVSSAVPRTAVPALLLLGLVGCSGAGEPVPPVPDPARVEPRVLQLLSELRHDVEDRPQEAAVWGRLAAAYHVHGMTPEAEHCYRRAVVLDPGAFRWVYLLAVLRQAQGTDVDEMVELFERARTLDPGHAPLLLRLGRALELRGQPREAESAYRRAIETDPSSADGHRNLGQLLLARDDVAPAVAELERALELDPHDGTIPIALAQAYARQGDAERASVTAARGAHLARRLSPEDRLYAEQVSSLGVASRHWMARGQALMEAGQFRRAVDELGVVLETRPDDAEVHYLVGVCHARIGDGDAAVLSLERALSLDPGQPAARRELAFVLSSGSAVVRSLPHYREALARTPDDAALLARFAEALTRAGTPEELVAVYERLALLVPRDTRVLVNLGTALGQAGEFEGAAARFREAIALDPDNADAHYRLGVALEALSRRREALE